MALSQKTILVLNPDATGAIPYHWNMRLLDEEAAGPSNKRAWTLAFIISLLANLSLLYLWDGLSSLQEQPTVQEKPMQLQLQLRPEVKISKPERVEQTVPQVAADADPAGAIDEEPATALLPVRQVIHTAPVSSVPPVPAVSVEDSATAVENVAKLLATPVVSISPDADFPGYLPSDSVSASDSFSDVFDPKLRQKLVNAQQQGSQLPGSRDLHTSTVADPYQRVAVDDKCFRLEDTNGGRMSQKIWYIAKCIDGEDESQKMIRAIRSRMSDSP